MAVANVVATAMDTVTMDTGVPTEVTEVGMADTTADTGEDTGDTTVDTAEDTGDMTVDTADMDADADAKTAVAISAEPEVDSEQNKLVS